ncbi:flagellar basal body L-ring protein FlgH [Psychromonas sp. Urea-02u-13]|uniref:flagellar basal body L-ring protein FlgH n=1 Tax=Psychromonas sp. Urea-02u-13 TaxID=2058326 RepID=UPI000C322573|nr:flagellar basal body L-ring protein FlgH [Psychromonas sp. Urea-02u-13]PKG40031.1 flagellar biosynthesis protein FlgH [Psychromonas sp. Urea-02u-13]
MNKFIVLFYLAFLPGCSAIVESVEGVTEKVQEKQDNEQRQVTASTHSSSPIPGDPYYAPIEPRREPAPIEITGSLFNIHIASDLYSYSPTFALGDTINVLLKEETVATKSAKSNLSNENDYTLDPITVPGGSMTVNGKVVELGMSQDQNFDGESGSSQRHNLSGRITVSVVDILNNGNLVVRGEKWLVINNGKEYIRLTGIIRPLDISEENSVESYQVADSRIEFSATGEHADVQTRGWLSSLFSGSLWPI